ncbi:MAG: hypothetical protein FWD13_01900 [Treponema sp.]|nr:hypothetical protein [Treponema sp.]
MMKTKLFSSVNVFLIGITVTMIFLSSCATGSAVDRMYAKMFKVKLVNKVMDRSIPSEEHARLFLYGGVTLIHRFDGSTSLISTAKQGETLLISPGTHNFYVMSKEVYGGPGRLVSTPHPGVQMFYDFLPGQLYYISGVIQGSTINYFIHSQEEMIADLDKTINDPLNDRVLNSSISLKNALVKFKQI